jgi:hypothetical protein
MAVSTLGGLQAAANSSRPKCGSADFLVRKRRQDDQPSRPATAGTMNMYRVHLTYFSHGHDLVGIGAARVRLPAIIKVTPGRVPQITKKAGIHAARQSRTPDTDIG